MRKPQIAVKVPPSLRDELNDYVSKTDPSKTDVIVIAVCD